MTLNIQELLHDLHNNSLHIEVTKWQKFIKKRQNQTGYVLHLGNLNGMPSLEWNDNCPFRPVGNLLTAFAENI
jgi:hypothetical protein